MLRKMKTSKIIQIEGFFFCFFLRWSIWDTREWQKHYSTWHLIFSSSEGVKKNNPSVSQVELHLNQVQMKHRGGEHHIDLIWFIEWNLCWTVWQRSQECWWGPFALMDGQRMVELYCPPMATDLQLNLNKMEKKTQNKTTNWPIYETLMVPLFACFVSLDELLLIWILEVRNKIYQQAQRHKGETLQ